MPRPRLRLPLHAPPFDENTPLGNHDQSNATTTLTASPQQGHGPPLHSPAAVSEGELRDVLPDTLPAHTFARTRQWALNLDEAEKAPLPPSEKAELVRPFAVVPDGVARLRGPLRRSASAPPVRNNREPSQPPRPIGPLFNKTLLEPSKPLSKPPGWRRSLVNALRHGWWLNILLVCAPISWALDSTVKTPVATFVTSALAIVPLAGQLGFATEEIALRTSDTIGGLLNATFGNAVELIISLLALIKNELDVVKNAMIGSILSNCLLVLGSCLFVAGVKRHESGYAVRAAQLNINLLGLCTAAIVLPVAFHATLQNSEQFSTQEISSDLLKLSRGIAIILLFAYAGYLSFQLWTHAYIFGPTPLNDDGRPTEPDLPVIPGPQPPSEGGVFRLPSWGSSSSSSSSSSSRSSDTDEDGKHQPKLSLPFSLVWLLVITGIAGYTSEVLVSSINDFQEATNINPVFIALIILPIIGNAAEHFTSITVAAKNKLDLSMSIAIGSSIQVALLILPLLVVIAWGLGKPLDMFFDVFVTISLFVSLVAISFAIGDARSNWMEGMSLVLIYVIIAVSVFFYPGVRSESSIAAAAAATASAVAA